MARIVTVGLIQDAVTGGTDATLAATIARIRDAAARGAQVICLKELFHAPYFCKALRQDRKSTRLNSSHSQQSRMPSSA